MTVAEVPGLGRFELDWKTIEHPTDDPGGDPWIIEIVSVWWIVDCSIQFLSVDVNRHAQWHVMPDGRCLSEHLEQWVYDHEEYPWDSYEDLDYWT